jgi:multicomponent Na+:H+ antiporter subunit A
VQENSVLLAVVISGFVLALGAPWLRQVLRDATGWVLAALPATLFAVFAAQAGAVGAGTTLYERYPWVPAMGADITLRLDGLSLLFALLITGIGALVLIYAGGYLKGDEHLGRLYAFLLLFMASMLGLVLSDNLLALFVFWELTTVSSYLLIGYKHRYEKARKAALQGLLVTGAGGLAMLAGFVLLGGVGGSFGITELGAQAALIQAHPLYGAILTLVLLGAFTKSAQFPFHFWLPGAMEAPSPVSAYLHSATMVKAGVFLLARLSPLLGGTAAWSTALLVAGTATLLVGYGLAVLQSDLKRILAYTTVAALGTLVLLLGLGGADAYKAAMAFLLAHALYKGALFMAAGTVDHEAGTRDIRQLGGLARAMPFTATATVLAALSMAGVPLLFGFVGKELLYKAALVQPLLIAMVVFANVLGVVASGLVGWRVFFGPAGALPTTPHEAPLALWLGPILLALLSVVTGIFPWLADGLVGAAASAVAGAPLEAKLVLWPGIEGANGIALALSGLTLVLGVGAYLLRSDLLATRINGRLRFGPERVYDATLEGTLALARWQTRVLQNGRLRAYLTLTLLTLVALAGATLTLRVPFGLPDLSTPRIYELALAGLMVAGTIGMVRASSRMAAVLSLGVVGYGMALVFLLYGGPDLAVTQFAIETLGVALFALVIARLPRYRLLSTPAGRVRDLLLAGAGGALFSLLALAAIQARAPSRLTPFFAENSLVLAYGRNVVNVILVDFRGFDTLGEITVLGIAAIGIYALISMRPADEPDVPRPEQASAAAAGARSLILSAAVRLLLPLLLVFSVFLLIRGHNAPGGGFAGGLVAAAGFVLYALADGVVRARRALPLGERTFIPLGLLIALASALLSLWQGQPFMTGVWLPAPLPVLGKIGTPVIFDAGVYFLVFGMALTIIFSLMSSPPTSAAPPTADLAATSVAEGEEREVTAWS